MGLRASFVIKPSSVTNVPLQIDADSPRIRSRVSSARWFQRLTILPFPEYSHEYAIALVGLAKAERLDCAC
jgi:hypothetical protein